MPVSHRPVPMPKELIFKKGTAKYKRWRKWLKKRYNNNTEIGKRMRK